MFISTKVKGINLHRVVIGVFFGKKGCKVYDLENGELFVGRDVVFFEMFFLMLLNKSQTKKSGKKWDPISVRKVQVCVRLMC